MSPLEIAQIIHMVYIVLRALRHVTRLKAPGGDRKKERGPNGGSDSARETTSKPFSHALRVLLPFASLIADDRSSLLPLLTASSLERPMYVYTIGVCKTCYHPQPVPASKHSVEYRQLQLRSLLPSEIGVPATLSLCKCRHT